MTDEYRDFIGKIATGWVGKQIQDGYGKPDTAAGTTYIARVLYVSSEGETPAPLAGGRVVGAPYFIKCRVLDANDMKGLEGFTWPSEGASIDNPDGWLQDPCFWSEEKFINKLIHQHPIYYPVDKDVKKPERGDIVKVRRQGPWQFGNFEYLGFLIKSPPIRMPKQKARGGGRKGGQVPSLRVMKKKACEKNKPKKYTKAELTTIATDVVYAINNWNSQIDQKAATVAIGTGAYMKPGFQVPPNLSTASDPRLQSLRPVIGNKDLTSIPQTWGKTGAELDIIVHYIDHLSKGYPGIPNSASRKYLMWENKTSAERLKEDADLLLTPLSMAPSIPKFATDEKYWKLWFDDCAVSPSTSTGVSNAGLRNKWSYLLRSQLPTIPTLGKEKIRFGLAMFEKSDAGKENGEGNLYFPLEAKEDLRIPHAGIFGAGDVHCEMYAFMMMIRIQFGTPQQMQEMFDFGRTRAGVDTDCNARITRCKDAFAGGFTQRRGGESILPKTLGDYEVDYSVMPRTSWFLCGLCDGYPPYGEV